MSGESKSLCVFLVVLLFPFARSGQRRFSTTICKPDKTVEAVGDSIISRAVWSGVVWLAGWLVCMTGTSVECRMALCVHGRVCLSLCVVTQNFSHKNAFALCFGRVRAPLYSIFKWHRRSTRVLLTQSLTKVCYIVCERGRDAIGCLIFKWIVRSVLRAELLKNSDADEEESLQLCGTMRTKIIHNAVCYVAIYARSI